MQTPLMRVLYLMYWSLSKKTLCLGQADNHIYHHDQFQQSRKWTGACLKRMFFLVQPLLSTSIGKRLSTRNPCVGSFLRSMRNPRAFRFNESLEEMSQKCFQESSVCVWPLSQASLNRLFWARQHSRPGKKGTPNHGVVYPPGSL